MRSRIVQHQLANRVGITLIALLVFFGAGTARSQAIALPRHSEPLMRPAPIVVALHGEPAALFRDLVSIVQDEGFLIETNNIAQGELVASRPHPDRAGDTERIVLWLERDFTNPDSQIRVYLLYGLFQEFLGETGQQRVVIEDGWKLEQTQALVSKITNHVFGLTPPARPEEDVAPAAPATR